MAKQRHFSTFTRSVCFIHYSFWIRNQWDNRLRDGFNNIRRNRLNNIRRLYACKALVVNNVHWACWFQTLHLNITFYRLRDSCYMRMQVFTETLPGTLALLCDISLIRKSLGSLRKYSVFFYPYLANEKYEIK